MQLKILNGVYYSSVKDVTTELHQFKYFLRQAFVYCCYCKKNGWGEVEIGTNLKFCPFSFSKGKNIPPQMLFGRFCPSNSRWDSVSLFHKNKLWDKCFNFHTLGISREKLFIRYFFKLLKSCWESTEIRSQLWTGLYSWDHSLLPENPRSTPLEGSTSLLQ